MLAEEVYLLDNMTYIETDPLPAFRGHSAVVAGLRAFRRLEKDLQYFVSVTTTYAGEFSFLAVRNALSLGTSPFGDCIKNYHAR